jgi:phosphoribosylformylglycinamidine cyclo-ligase
MLPEGVKALIRRDSYSVPPIFGMLQKDGQIEERSMYNTFNMGIGMVMAVDKKDAGKAMEAVEKAGEKAYLIGEVAEGEKCCELV